MLEDAEALTVSGVLKDDRTTHTFFCLGQRASLVVTLPGTSLRNGTAGDQLLDANDVQRQVYFN